MGCYSDQEIADAVGFSRRSISEFTELLQVGENGIGAENADLSENPELTNDSENREFDEDESPASIGRIDFSRARNEKKPHR